MWKVTNENNRLYLIEFRNSIIEPILISISKHLTNRKHRGFKEYINESYTDNQNKLLSYVVNKQHKKVKIDD